MILSVPPNSRSMVSRYMRWRVTVGRLLVFVIDLEEARGLALGLGDGLLAIGFGSLDDLGSAAARFRHHAIGVGLRLVLRALQIGAGGLHVAEGVDHLRGRIDLLQLHLGDLDSGPVLIENLLHQFLHRGFDVLARSGQNRLDVGAPDHLAHSALGDRLHGALGLLDVEQVFADAFRLDPPQHREIDIDDVLVAGEHQAFFRHIANRAAAAQILDHAHSDIDLVDSQRPWA